MSIISEPVQNVLSKLEKVKPAGEGKWVGSCPNKAAHKHGDRNPSLSIAQGDDGRVLLNCHGGCTIKSIVAAMGMKAADLFPPKEANRRIVETYPYVDERGELLYEVIRYDPKDFRQRQPDGNGGWIWKMKEVRRVLYRLPELLAAGAMETIFIVEGEKDVETIHKAGLVATCNVGGAGKWRDEYNEPMRGRRVVVIADKDAPGRKHGRQVCASLDSLARYLELPGDNVKDASDWFAAGGTAEKLLELSREADVFDPDQADEQVEDESGPVLICMADVKAKPINWLWPGRIVSGAITIFNGYPGDGKSLVTIALASHVTTGTPWPDGSPCSMGPVILITYEDDRAQVIRPRLDVHHADVSKVHHFDTVKRPNPETGELDEVMFTLADARSLRAVVERIKPALIIIDPAGSATGGDIDFHRENEVRGVLSPVSKLAEKYGVAVVVVSHRRKAAGHRADDLALGSRAFTGIARAAWHITVDPDDKTRRLFLAGKNNFGPPMNGLAFRIIDNNGTGQVVWEKEPVQMNADEALAVENGNGDKPGPEPEARNAAVEWLRDRLKDGPVYVGDQKAPDPGTIRADIKEAGLSWRTVRRAADELGVKSEKCRFKGKYQWRLSNSGCPHPSNANNVDNLDNQQNTAEKPPVSHAEDTGCPSGESMDNQGRERGEI
jgi:hypothetical protein